MSMMMNQTQMVKSNTSTFIRLTAPSKTHHRVKLHQSFIPIIFKLWAISLSEKYKNSGKGQKSRSNATEV